MDVQRCAYANSLCYRYIFFFASLVILLVIILGICYVTGNRVWTYLCKYGHWELLSVEAYVYQLENGSRSLQCITLT